MRLLDRMMFLSVVAVAACGPTRAPFPPASLDAAPAGPTSVRLGWVDRSDDESGFVIERGTAPAELLEVAVIEANAVSWQDSALEPGRTYFYRVSANNEAGISDPTPVVRVTTPATATPPIEPTNLVANLAKGNVVRLSWADHANNEIGFLIERLQQISELEAIGGIWNQAGAVGPNVTTFVDKHVVGGVTYTYRVAAFNGIGYSSWSNLAVVRVPGGTVAPAAPSGLTTKLDLDGVHLSWTDRSDGQAAFELERTIVEGRWLGIAVTEPGTTTLVASPVLAGDASFRVRAFNAAGASEWSNVAAVVLPKHDQGLAPAAPSGLELTILDGTTRLTWHDNSTNETGFEVERLTLSYFQPIWDAVGVADRDVTMFVDEARPPGTLAYRVRAINASGDSDWVTQLIAFTQ